MRRLASAQRRPYRPQRLGLAFFASFAIFFAIFAVKSFSCRLPEDPLTAKYAKKS
jgi:hypothetical protein